MEALSVREYRNNLAASFTKADNGEQVLIRRKNEIYALVKVGREDLMITPELQARIDKSRHITAHDRIIYDIYEEVVEVYILEVEGHYNDK
jgi:Txe/YoeB family toxin of Txe-Axe toxin-antitoxin module